MSEIGLVDTTLRDGNQSIWGATGLTTPMVLRAAPIMERARYAAVELTNSTAMAVAVRWHREDPWERIRRASALLPGTRRGFITTGLRFISFYRTPDTLMRLAFELLIRAGINRFWIVDPMNDVTSVLRAARMI